LACSFSQRPKSTVPGNGVIMTNWAKVTPALRRHFDGGVEGGGLVGGQAEDEGAEDVDAVLLEGLELFGEAGRRSSSSP
jgi:hypothetical protein